MGCQEKELDLKRKVVKDLSEKLSSIKKKNRVYSKSVKMEMINAVADELISELRNISDNISDDLKDLDIYSDDVTYVAARTEKVNAGVLFNFGFAFHNKNKLNDKGEPEYGMLFREVILELR